MKILILSMWYYPEPVNKPHDLASELARRGHQVTVITGYPNYPQGKLYDGYDIQACRRETICGVRVFRVAHFVNRSHSAIKRVLSYLSFSMAAFVAGIAFANKPDIIWTYQLGLPGLLLSTFKRKPWVHEVQDLWPEWAEQAMSGLTGTLSHMLATQERLIYKRAHCLITISKGLKNALLNKGVPESRIQVIPNWANERYLQPESRSPVLGDLTGLNGRFNIIYAGNVGTAQRLGVILEAAQLLQDLPEVQFVVIGDGVERAKLEQRARSLRLENVRFLGICPPDELSHYYAFADVLFLSLGSSPVYQVTIPSKTYSYLASGRPILAAASGEVAELIREIGAGKVCPPEDPQALAKAVRELYAMPSAQREAMGTAGRSAFLKRYTCRSIVDRYQALFEQMIHQKYRNQGTESGAK